MSDETTSPDEPTPAPAPVPPVEPQPASAYDRLVAEIGRQHDAAIRRAAEGQCRFESAALHELVQFAAPAPVETDTAPDDDLDYFRRATNALRLELPEAVADDFCPRAMAVADEIERLRSWKSSAMTVLAQWDAVHIALGSPGRVGESMPVASAREAERLRAAVSSDDLRSRIEAANELIVRFWCEDAPTGSGVSAEIVAHVAALPEHERAALFAAIGDEELQSEVDALLASEPTPEPKS